MIQLKEPQKKVLRNASRHSVDQVLAELVYYFSRGSWIGKGNRYRRKCIKKLSDDTNLTRPSRINHKHLREYITASAFLHCTDAWSYVGKALCCHNRGDIHISRHLGYYAELRAAMAILAAEGIGIFHNKHFALDSSRTCKRISREMPTHQITWLALDHWANLKRSTDLMALIIKPGGYCLDEWLDRFTAGTSLRFVGADWLRTWGLDLNRLSKDRDARNEASYRPTRIGINVDIKTLSHVEFLHKIWSVLQPAGTSPFMILDRYLLRLGLEKSYYITKGFHAKDKRVDFTRNIKDTIRNLNPTGLSSKLWIDFLIRAIEPDDPILIREANGKLEADHPGHHMQVISRAILLLRVATGSCKRLLNDCDITKNDLKFWLNQYGQDFGLWDVGQQPSDMMDLWADINAALDSVNPAVRSNQQYCNSFYKWQRNQADAISLLEGCERIALWGFGL